MNKLNCVLIVVLSTIIAGNVYANPMEGPSHPSGKEMPAGHHPHKSAMSSIDVDSIINAESAKARQEIVREIFKKMILGEDYYPSLHAVDLVYTMNQDYGLSDAVWEKLNSLGDSKKELEFKIECMRFLIKHKQENFTREIKELLYHYNGKVRELALRLAKESGDSSLTEAVKERLRIEGSPYVKTVALGTLTKLDPSNKDKYLAQLSIIDSTDSSVRTEAARQRIDAGDKDQTLNTIFLQESHDPGEKAVIDALAGRQFDQEQMKTYILNTTNHGLRIEATRILEKRATTSSKKWFEDLGASNRWQERAIGAHYLLLSGQKKEAFRRLKEEKVPMVQVLLMSVLLSEEGVE